MPVGRTKTTLQAAGVTMRPRQWVKNAFVFAAPVFGRTLHEGANILSAGLTFIAFCLLSSAVYAFNDICDREKDAQHPIKRFRPIATGTLSVRNAAYIASGLAVAGLLLALVVGQWVAFFAAAYLVNNLFYSLFLRRVAYLDVGLIATGFLLRVIAGAWAVAVEPSEWLLLCTALLAMLLGFGKRYHEIKTIPVVEGTIPPARAALGAYTKSGLKVLIVALALTSCAAYVLYTLAPMTISEFGSNTLMYTIPFCVFGILRFCYLTFRAAGSGKSAGTRAQTSPTDAMLSDPIFIVNILCFCAVAGWVVYGDHSLG